MTKIIDRRKQAMGGSSKRKLSQIKNIAVHYSATSTGDTSTFEKHWKNTRGWNTGGYHEVVLLNGDVELNYNPDVISNGVLNHNTSTYNICYVGAGQPTKAQRKTLIDRIAYNKKRFGIADKNIKGHRDFSGASTQCPAVNVSDLVKETGKSDEPKTNPKTKTISQMAQEVIAGKHGEGNSKRQKSLGISAAEYEKVRSEVNKRVKAPAHANTTKTITQMAREVINGDHGQGHANRLRSLRVGDATYKKVRAEVNKLVGGNTSKPKQSVNQMATRIINDPKAPKGHDARRKWLGVSDASYQKVRAEVNKRL